MRAGDSGDVYVQEVESRVSVQVGVTIRDWRHQHYPQEIFWEKLTKLTFTKITRAWRDIL